MFLSVSFFHDWNTLKGNTNCKWAIHMYLPEHCFTWQYRVQFCGISYGGCDSILSAHYIIRLHDMVRSGHADLYRCTLLPLPLPHGSRQLGYRLCGFSYASFRAVIHQCRGKRVVCSCIYVPPPNVRGATLVSVRIPGVGVSVTVCIHHISWINGWNFTRLAWIQHWDKSKSWLSFGDSDPIFKVTGGLRLLNVLRRRRCRRDRFLYARYFLNQRMKCHQTFMDISLWHA